MGWGEGRWGRLLGKDTVRRCERERERGRNEGLGRLPSLSPSLLLRKAAERGTELWGAEGAGRAPLHLRPAAAAPSCIGIRCRRVPLHLRPAAAASSCISTPLRPRPAASPPRCGRVPLHLRPAAAAPSCISTALRPRPAASRRPAAAVPSSLAASPPRCGRWVVTGFRSFPRHVQETKLPAI